MSVIDPPPRRVVIVRALQLGDLLCAVPALRALRHLWPHARFALVGLPWARAFVSRFSAYLDGFHEFPGWPGLPDWIPDILRIPAFLQTVQDEHYDLAVQLHGSGNIVNELTLLLGARRTAGFYPAGTSCPDSAMFLRYPNEGLEVNRLLKLALHLGAGPRGEHLELPLMDPDRRAFMGLGLPIQPASYVCVHPGASVAPRRWPADNFRRVAIALAEKGYTIVFTGTAAESCLTEPLAAAVPHALDLAGKTDLGTLGVLLSEARLLICNDTGVSHIAAAVRTPSVVISTGDNPSRWAPSDCDRHRVLSCDTGVPVDAVLEQAFELLNAVPSVPIAVRD